MSQNQQNTLYGNPVRWDSFGRASTDILDTLGQNLAGRGEGVLGSLSRLVLAADAYGKQGFQGASRVYDAQQVEQDRQAKILTDPFVQKMFREDPDQAERIFGVRPPFAQLGQERQFPMVHPQQQREFSEQENILRRAEVETDPVKQKMILSGQYSPNETELLVQEQARKLGYDPAVDRRSWSIGPTGHVSMSQAQKPRRDLTLDEVFKARDLIAAQFPGLVIAPNFTGYYSEDNQPLFSVDVGTARQGKSPTEFGLKLQAYIDKATATGEEPSAEGFFAAQRGQKIVDREEEKFADVNNVLRDYNVGFEDFTGAEQQALRNVVKTLGKPEELNSMLSYMLQQAETPEAQEAIRGMMGKSPEEILQEFINTARVRKGLPPMDPDEFLNKEIEKISKREDVSETLKLDLLPEEEETATYRSPRRPERRIEGGRIVGEISPNQAPRVGALDAFGRPFEGEFSAKLPGQGFLSPFNVGPKAREPSPKPTVQIDSIVRKPSPTPVPTMGVQPHIAEFASEQESKNIGKMVKEDWLRGERNVVISYLSKVLRNAEGATPDDKLKAVERILMNSGLPPEDQIEIMNLMMEVL
jgi:hypothetical protein